MDRTACIDLPAFPLQLLLRRRPDWRGYPAAVVEEDRPQARILWVNERARGSRILPGMRYAAGLSLDGGLRADVVPSREIERAVAAVAERLRRHSPVVEPAREDPGAFWLDASGLVPLHGSLREWGRRLLEDLGGLGFDGTLVIGFHRFGAYALAKAGAIPRGSRPWRQARRGPLPDDGARRLFLPRGPGEEGALLRRVPLERLNLGMLNARAREVLRRLGVRTVGDLLDLPAEGVEQRFGADLGHLHRQASGALQIPLRPDRPPAPPAQRLELEHAETDRRRLLAGMEPLVAMLLARLAERGEGLVRLRVGLEFEGGGRQAETLATAAPTLDFPQVANLLRLRLEAVRLPHGVEAVALEAEGVPVPADQRLLFARRPPRDLEAAGRALARVRAALGDGAVVRARLRDGHLPEARFCWEPAEEVAEPRPPQVEGDGMVRRLYGPPVPLPPRARHEPDGWMLRGLEQGPVVRVLGPYVVSGGWWGRPVRRDYHFAETQRGEILWVYYDRSRRRWYLQGRVE